MNSSKDYKDRNLSILKLYSFLQRNFSFFLLSFAFLSLIFFLFTSINALNIYEFSDETETLVAAQLIHEGKRLYHDIFESHGPLIYAMTHLYTSLVSPSNFSYVRVFLVLFAFIAGISIAASPVFPTKKSRILAFALYFCFVSSYWVFQNLHQLTYYTVSGFLMIIISFQLFLPLFLNCTPKKSGLFLSGICLIFLLCNSYSNIPSALGILCASLLLIVQFKNKIRLTAILLSGMLTAFGLMGYWLFRFADLKGLIIYHMIFNQTVFSKFSSFNILHNLLLLFTQISLKPIAFIHNPIALIHTTCMFFTLVWICFLLSEIKIQLFSSYKIWVKICAFIIFVISIFFLNLRGSIAFHNAAFVLCSTSLFVTSCSLILFTKKIKILKQFVLFILPVTLVSTIMAFTYLGIRRDINHRRFLLKPDSNNLISQITHSEDSILSLPNDPIVYIQTNRRPASGHFYYFPWQAQYKKNPIQGYNIDICDDIIRNSPAAIRINTDPIGGVYKLEEYEPCIFKLLLKNYTKLGKNIRWYLRNDRFSELSTREFSTAYIEQVYY